MELILASQSPRRLQLLQAAGLSPQVLPSHIDESIHPDETPIESALRLCREKSLACPVSDKPVIAADTLVILDNQAFGQPQSREQAAEMIRKLSGRTHQVITAVCVRYGTQTSTESVITRVTFRDIRDDEIPRYLDHNHVMDKAGAYAIQEGASGFITAIDGPLDNVIGLPVQTTLRMLDALQVSR